MTKDYKTKTSKIAARLCIWTIKNHDFLTARLRVYVWSATATILFFSVASIIHIEAALISIMIGALSIAALLWLLINYRKKLLLNIEDPVLKQQAYDAMIKFLYIRKNRLESGDFLHRFLNHFNV